jgi:hypothetical protein
MFRPPARSPRISGVLPCIGAKFVSLLLPPITFLLAESLLKDSESFLSETRVPLDK